MVLRERLLERIASVGISQAELARRVGVSQKTINKLALGSAYGSKHLHRIARELGTSAAYLAGEVDDPAPDAPVLARGEAARLVVSVSLPPEATLARKLEAELVSLRELDEPDRARALARRLPALLETRLGYAHEPPAED